MRFVLAMYLAVQVGAACGAASEDSGWLKGQFDQRLAEGLDAALEKPGNNDAGGIAWGQSYQLEALVEMLAATGDLRYANAFMKLADWVAAARDDRHGLKDEIRGKVLPAWGSTKYTEGKRYVWAVHTGMIAARMARFAAVIRSRPELKGRYGQDAARFLKIAEEAVAVHDDQYRQGPAPDEGRLYGLYTRMHLPLNMQNALARAWLAIDDANETPRHRERVTRLAQFFKNRMRPADDGAYVWEYRPPLDNAGKGFEDISHASINVDFAVQCFEHGMVFTRDDVNRLEKTLLVRVMRSDGTVANYVGGTGGGNKYAGQALRWGRLARHSPAARERLVRFCRTQNPKVANPVTDWLGIAYLVAASSPATRPGAAATTVSPAVHATQVESLGQPCRAKQILGATMVVDRQDGRERLVLLNDNEAYRCELLYIDFHKDQGEAFTAPAGAGSWCGLEVPGDRIIIGTFYDGTFMVFDLKEKKFTKAVKFPGEQYIWNLALGSDGRVYGGTYPGGKLGALNLETYTIEDLGAPAPPNQYLRMVSAAPWGQIFCNLGMGEPTTQLYDIKSKQWRKIPGLKPKDTFGVGVSWNGYFVANDPRSGKIEAFKDESLNPAGKLPFPVPEGGFDVNTALSNAKDLYIAQGRALYRYSAGTPEFKLTKVLDMDLRSGRVVAVAKDGAAIGVRGQAYFVVRPGERELKLRPIPVESKGRPALFLEGDPHGRIWGGPHFGQTLFHYDTQTSKAVNTDVICDAGGEVYDVTFHKGKVYAASYAGGDITEYDPAQPWDQLNHKNPRPLAKVSPAYIRPEGGIVTGPDGKLYAGWMAKYGTYGGAVSITDPESGKTELIENPLGNQAIHTIAVDRDHIYIGTNLGGNGLPNQKGQAKFGVIELATRRIVFEKPMHISRLALEPRTGLVAFTAGPALHLYDPKNRSMTAGPINGLPPVTGRRMVPDGDGRLIAAAGKRIIRIDLGARSFAAVAESQVDIDSIALGADGRVYFDSGPELCRTTTPVVVRE